jgi:hypothetical protein
LLWALFESVTFHNHGVFGRFSKNLSQPRCACSAVGSEDVGAQPPAVRERRHEMDQFTPVDTMDASNYLRAAITPSGTGSVGNLHFLMPVTGFENKVSR